MALAKQKVSLPFSEGISTKIDPFQKPIGTLQNLENAVFDTPGRIKKRTGYDKLSTSLITDELIADAQKITTYKDELCIFDKTNFYSYSSSTEKWTEKGTVSNIFPTSSSVLRNTYQQENIDSTYVAGAEVYAWEDGRGGIRISMIDSSTGNELISDTEITPSGIFPKVEYIGNKAYIFYIDSTDIKYRVVNPADPSTIESEVTIVSSDVDSSDKIYDTYSVQSRIFVSWNSGSSTLKCVNIQEDGTLSSISEDAGENPSVAIGLSADASNRILISFYDGSDVKVIIKSFGLTANLLAATSIETIADVTNVAISENSSMNYNIVYEVSAAQTYNHFVKTNTITLAGSVGTPSVFLRSVGLASKIFTYESNLYIALIHKSTLQSTILIANESAEIVSKISPSLSGDLISPGHLPNVNIIQSGMFLLSSQIKGRTVSEGNTIFSVLGVNKTVLNFNLEVKYDNALLGQNLHTTGGIIQSYDGKSIVEHGFHFYPENVSAGTNSSSGGSMSDGTFNYAAVYSWIDNKGQQHRSASSIPIEVTTTAGGTSQSQEIIVPTLRITEKENVTIELYRTEDTWTVFYLVTSVTSPEYNDPSVDTITITDTLSDLQLISNELLYDTSGELENIAPPAASIIETFNNRVFLAGLEDENQIQYSKIRFEDKPVEFNDTLVINVNSKGGRIKALATIEDKLVIFKETSIFYITGDGPNNLGEQNTFTEPELISNDVGCETQNSIVLTPLGLMFKSKKGIYVLNQALQPSYIGADVEDYNNLTITSATLKPTKDQAVFLTNGQALSYNYFVGKWSIFTNHRGISSTSLQDKYYYVRNDNDVYVEANHFTDAGSYIKLKLETSWISFAGVQGYQRVYRSLLLGEYKSNHKLILKAAYNFIDSYIHEKIIDVTDFTEDTVYGGDSPYGSGSPYGGTGNKYNIRLNFKKQKCESIKISIEDSQSDSFGEGLQLSNILFIVGVKASEYKTPQSVNYGTNS